MTRTSKLNASVSAAVLVSALWSTAALAQPNADTGASESEIVVTARRKEEKLQDIPLAISAFSAERIEREDLRRIDDLTKFTAGLTFDIGGFPNDTRPALRGMQAERGRPSVAVLLDGQDLSGENISIAGGSGALRMNLFDLERIEVVKGPQATLYGRNAFAGAINYISRQPTMEWEGRVAAEYATGNMGMISASASGPIVADKLAIRVNGNYRSGDGYYDNPVNGGKLGAETSQGFAVAALFRPIEDLEIKGRYQHSKDRASDNPTAFIGANRRLPVPGGTFTAGPPGTPPSACPPSLTGLPAAAVTACTRGTFIGKITATEANVQMGLNPLTGLPPYGMRMTSDIASGDIDWDSGFGEFHYSFGYLKDRTRIEQDGDFTSFPAPPGLVLSIHALQDLDYRNKHNDHTFYWQHDIGKVDLIAGVQRFTETSSLVNGSQFYLRSATSPLAGPPFRLATAPIRPVTFPVTITRETEYTGFFGGVGFQITDAFKISAEARQNRDKIDYTSTGQRRQDVSLSRLTPTCIPTLAPGATFVATSPATSPPPGTVNACPITGNLKYNKFTPRITAEYRVNDDVLAYATYAKGFKPGGFNTNEVATFANQSYNPESVKAYEVGLKTEWLDNRLVINVDGYYNDYTDQQIGVQLSTPGAGGQIVTSAGIVNAGAVSIYGFEADVSYRVSDPLSLTMSYAYTDAEFDSYVQGPPPGSPAAAFTTCGVPATQTSSDQNRAEAGNLCADFAGKKVGKSPKHSLNMSGLWEQEVAGLPAFVEITSSFRSKRFTDESNLAFLPSYWLWGVKAGVDYGALNLTAYVDNVFDSRKIRSAQRNVDFGNPEGFAPGRAFIAYLPSPRVVGVRAAVKF
jgi:outer membrane receptor protein involved in Fe transport